jgi:RNA-directed DNA polymerase
MEQIASEETLEEAFVWLCKKRKDYSHNNDVWDLRRLWRVILPQIRKSLLKGTYCFDVQQKIRFPDQTIELWSSMDALVLKAMALVLSRYFKPHISKQCVHVKGNGGAKQAVRQVNEHLGDNRFVFRSDVKSYYASINHIILLDQLRPYIQDQSLISLIFDYLRRTIDNGGLYQDIKRGISLGCPLSPLMGALCLKLMDDRIEKTGLFYVRFMDDWVVLAPGRWKLRKAILIINQTLNVLKLEKHPDKTFIGRIEKGFDFLGYRFGPGGLSIAPQTLNRFKERIARLYEQGADNKRIGQYVKNWKLWASLV